MIRATLKRVVRKLRARRPARPSFMAEDVQYADFEVGEWTYGKPTVFYGGGSATLKIGRFCSIARHVTILLGGEHNVNWVTTYPFPEVFDEARGFTGHPASRGSVVIGNDVWIGRDTLILSGVTIGDGAVIGAGSLVRKDVQPYAIVYGNPAQHSRFRFSASQIEALQRIAWWDWPLPRIVEALPLLLAPDIDAFIARYDVQTPIPAAESASTVGLPPRRD
jgi:virginiamycin A acetyltransferase